MPSILQTKSLVKLVLFCVLAREKEYSAKNDSSINFLTFNIARMYCIYSGKN